MDSPQQQPPPALAPPCTANANTSAAPSLPNLPTSLQVAILAQLDVGSVAAAAAVCTAWRECGAHGRGATAARSMALSGWRGRARRSAKAHAACGSGGAQKAPAWAHERDMPSNEDAVVVYRGQSFVLTAMSVDTNALDDSVWQALALARYPPQTVSLKAYASYRELLLDDNRRGATPGLQLSCFSMWRKNWLWGFYGCRLLSLEWRWVVDRDGTYGMDRELCLSFDARGERDLRPADESSLAVVTLQPAAPRVDRGASAGGLQLSAATPAGAPAPGGSEGTAAGSTGCLPTASMLGAPVPGKAGYRFEALHAGYRPAYCKIYTHRIGHIKGVLRWSARASADLASELEQPGRALVFCYANNLASSRHLAYQSGWPDYTSTVLLATSPGITGMKAAWLSAGGKYFEAGACEQAVATATADDERVQWNVEDQDTALRHPPGLFASVLRRGQLPQQQQGSRAEWWVRWAPPIREPAWQDVARSIVFDHPFVEDLEWMMGWEDGDDIEEDEVDVGVDEDVEYASDDE